MEIMLSILLIVVSAEVISDGKIRKALFRRTKKTPPADKTSTVFDDNFNKPRC